LVIDNISKYYSQWQRSGQVKDIVKNLFRPDKRIVTALNSVSLSVNKGEFVAYAGANGAGKSTTIKILCGILQPSEGNVSVLGLNPAKDRIKLMKRTGIVFGQRTELWWDHPVITSFQWKKTVWDIPEAVYKKNLDMVTELLDLKDILYTFSRELSLGQRMRADLGMMLLHGPEMIFLDEPTLGLDVLAKRQMIDFLKQLNSEINTTIIVTSHDMDDLEEMAKRIILLSKGQIAFDGDFNSLRKIQGNLCRIKITTDSATPENIDMLRYISSEANTHEYEFDRSTVSVKEIFALLSNLDDISDFELNKAPLEQIIASLYQSWRS
jgi:ABC-2 type transport system ATP-binding protein